MFQNYFKIGWFYLKIINIIKGFIIINSKWCLLPTILMLYVVDFYYSGNWDAECLIHFLPKVIVYKNW